jgi:putative two-component system response regulator
MTALEGHRILGSATRRSEEGQDPRDVHGLHNASAGGEMSTVLIADDDPALRLLVRETIASDHYTVVEAANGDEAWQLLQEHHPAIALLDVQMPGRTGLELARAIKGEPHLAEARVVLLTGLATRADIAAGWAAGADAYITKPFSPLALLTAIDRALGQPCLTGVDVAPHGGPADGPTADSQLMAYAKDLRRSYEDERARRQELQAAYLATLKVLAAAIETRDPYTGGHAERVATYSVAIGRELGWDAERLATLELGAALHDVGKIGIPDQVLRKPGPLDAEEWKQMRQHPAMGARMLQHVPFLHGAAICTLRHHERFDGQGYPDGLAGEAIPEDARVVAIADAFDAMTTDRPCRRALSTAIAIAEIERGAGTQFDPTGVAAFLRAVRSGAIVAADDATDSRAPNAPRCAVASGDHAEAPTPVLAGR